MRGIEYRRPPCGTRKLDDSLSGPSWHLKGSFSLDYLLSVSVAHHRGRRVRGTTDRNERPVQRQILVSRIAGRDNEQQECMLQATRTPLSWKTDST